MLRTIIEKFSSARSFVDGNKRNLLFIAPRLPEFDRASGDLRLYRMLEILSRSYNLFYFNDGMWERFLKRGNTKYLDALRTMGVNVLLTERGLRKAFGKYRFSAVVTEFYHLGEKYRQEIKRLAPGAPLTIDSVDVHFLRERLMAETLGDNRLRDESDKTRREEVNAYGNADYVWVVSDLDREALLAEGIAEAKICVVPNIHTVADNPPPFAERRRNTLLFIGGFVHQPNVDAVEYLCREILPLVREQVPEAKLLVVGDNPPESIKLMADANVEVLGFVPETRPYVDGAIVSVAPLRYGAGLKGKVGEALAAGLPLVTTSIGAQGMKLVSGRDCFIADSPAEFAADVVRLLREPELWRAFSNNGRSFMAENFGYESVRENLLGFFDSLEGK